MKKNNVSQPWPWLKSWLFFLAAIIIFLSLAINFYQTWQRRQGVRAEIETLKKEIINLEQNKIELSELIDYLNSTAYIEKKARTDLGLKKIGEKTVIIPNLNQPITPQQLEADQKSSDLSNPIKWWHYFLKTK